MEQFLYNIETRSFTDIPTMVDSNGNKIKNSSVAKNILLTVGISTGLAVLPKVLDAISTKLGNRNRDSLLYRSNEKMNELSDNYMKGKSSEVTPEITKKYKTEISDLISYAIGLAKYDSKDKSSPKVLVYNSEADALKSTKVISNNKDSIYNTVIAPFAGVLRMILRSDVHVLLGSNIGGDRRNFELCYDQDHKNPEDVAKDRFRTVLFRHKWPSHGFDVTSYGQTEANLLINDTVDFLSKNPKYLIIRV
jgi:hypothetical protein